MAYVRNYNFVEGITKRLIDKTNNSKWEPSSFEEIQQSQLAPYFVNYEGPKLII